MENQPNRIPCLDGLRAISIGLVVISHFVGALGLQINTTVGNLGVRVFFVISGFLITSILASEFEKTSNLNLKKFYFRRTLRIFPAYYFYISVIFLFTLIGFYDISKRSFISPLTYTSNYLFPNVWELGHTWSLSVEEQFYLLFPGILLILGLRRTKKLLLFIILVAPVIRLINLNDTPPSSDGLVTQWLAFGFHTNMDALATGCLLSLGRKELHLNEHYIKFLDSPKIVPVLPVIIFFVIFCSGFTFAFFSLGFTIMNIAIALTIDWLIVNHESDFGKILNSPSFVFVGTLSYSIYLWQQPFINYSEGKTWTLFPFNIILMILFSLFSYFVVEKKFLQLRQSWEKGLFNKTQEKTILQTNIHHETI
jgi:peptidoglycan/LPS O-acetylase OafA/YrhL